LSAPPIPPSRNEGPIILERRGEIEDGRGREGERERRGGEGRGRDERKEYGSHFWIKFTPLMTT